MTPLPDQAPWPQIIKGILVTTLIGGITLVFPLASIATMFIIPLPVLIYRSRLGRKAGALVPAGTILLLAALTQATAPEILFWSLILLLGYLLGEFIEHGLGIDGLMIYSVGGVLLLGVLGLLGVSLLSGQGPVALVEQYVAANLQLTLQLYQDIGLPDDTLETLNRSLPELQYALTRLLPAMVGLTLTVISWVTLLLARRVLPLLGLPFPDLGPLNQWRSPEVLVWVAIGCGVLLLAPVRGIKMAALNGLVMMLSVYFFQGIAIVAYFFEKRGVSRPIRICLYSLLVFQQILLLLVIGLGFFDLWVNFRKLTPNQTG